MNSSEIAERAARELAEEIASSITPVEVMWGDELMVIRMAEIGKKFVERAIEESRGQPRDLSDLDWDTICAERDHWRAIAVKAVPGCNAPFGEDEDITMEDVIGEVAESQAPHKCWCANDSDTCVACWPERQVMPNEGKTEEHFSRTDLRPNSAVAGDASAKTRAEESRGQPDGKES